MVINNITIEARPRLQACQVYVLFANDTDAESVNIRVRKKRLCFWTTSDREQIIINVGKYNFVSNSITGLSLEANSMSFRVMIETDSSTVFNMNEFLECLKRDNEISCSFALTDDVKNLVNEPVSLLCKNCERDIVGRRLIFERFLPLPSDGVEMSDMFCHASSDIANVFSSASVMRERDFLYGDCFFYVKQRNDEKLIVPSVTTVASKVVRCTHCHSWLGIRCKERLKLWYSTVKLDGAAIKPDDNQPECEQSSLKDFTVALKNALNSLILKQRVEMKCELEGGRTDRLSLTVIDRRLEIYKGDNSDAKENVYDLKQRRAMKVLFNFRETSDIAEESLWKNDEKCDAVEVDISEPMMLVGKTSLFHSHRTLPKSSSVIGKLLVAYLLID